MYTLGDSRSTIQDWNRESLNSKRVPAGKSLSISPEQLAYLRVRGRFDVGDPQAAGPGFQAKTGQPVVEVRLLEDPRLPLPADCETESKSGTRTSLPFR